MKNFLYKKTEKDLLLINALSVTLVLSIIMVPESPLRIVLGIPFVLFFPGYTLIAALFPEKQSLGKVERLALSMGLSLTVVPLIGLALNYAPWGITLFPIITSLFILTIFFSLISNYRRNKLSTDQKLVFAIPKMPAWNTFHNSDKIFILGFLVAIILFGCFTVYIASAPKNAERFTEFYVLGSTGQLEDYPLNFTIGQTGTVMLGITNHEYETLSYRIVVGINNQTIGTIDGIRLNHGETWNQPYSITPEITGEKMKLDYQLYKQDSTEPYRSLQLWITVQPLE